MKKNKKESFFWTSYSDLMTSLFFVMLVLFVITIALMHKSNQRNAVNAHKFEFIQMAQNATLDLDKTPYFAYNPKYNKYVLKVAVNFAEYSSRIDTLQKATLDSLASAGEIISDFMERHNNTQYLLIIEGQASNDNYNNNYELSYQRSINLVRFWNAQAKLQGRRIIFGKNCEVQISGSGDGKLSGTNHMRAKKEAENQRFLIHVIPKLGRI